GRPLFESGDAGERRQHRRHRVLRSVRPASGGASSPIPGPAVLTVVFLLSPASCGGRRAQLLLREAADFPLARRLRSDGAPLGEVFSFLSGLYFRGKLTYATRFARPPQGVRGVHVITTSSGLLDPS